MRQTLKWLLALTVAFALGAVAGGYLVNDATTGLMIDRAVDADAAAVRRYVPILEAMRAGEADEAVELLEAWLDDVLVVLMEPSNYDFDIRPITLARADSAYAAARAHREAWPRTSSRSFVDDMVAAVWAQGPPSQLP
jgi:hypothetical protein